MGQFLSSIILFIIPGYIAAVLRCGNGEKKNPLQLAADTLCYAFLILAAVSGILYALFGDGDFLVKYQGDVLLYVFCFAGTYGFSFVLGMFRRQRGSGADARGRKLLLVFTGLWAVVLAGNSL